MLFRTLRRQPVAGSLALIALAATAATADAADVTITNAEIAGGKLVITGTTATPNMRLRLDAQTAEDFNVISNPNRAFSFSLVYHPGDCIVALQKFTPPSTLGPAASALVADCGPSGVSPRGAWAETASYLTNDLVTLGGSTWRARRSNLNSPPATNSADWEVFASIGDEGPAGPAGPQGPAGPYLDSPTDSPDGPAGGDLAGNYPNPTIRNQAVTAGKIALGGVTTARIADEAVTTLKIAVGAVSAGRIAPNAVTGTRLANNAVTSAKVLDDTAGGGLTAADLASDSVGFAEIQTDAVQATEIADNSIDSGEIVDFGLSNQDVGVLFAEVNANGTLANSSGNVTAVKLAGAGNYEVDFGRTITACTAVATIGPAGAGGAIGEINVADRSGNVEAVFVDTNTSAGASSDQPFRLVVVC